MDKILLTLTNASVAHIASLGISNAQLSISLEQALVTRAQNAGRVSIFLADSWMYNDSKLDTQIVLHPYLYYADVIQVSPEQHGVVSPFALRSGLPRGMDPEVLLACLDSHMGQHIMREICDAVRIGESAEVVGSMMEILREYVEQNTLWDSK